MATKQHLPVAVPKGRHVLGSYSEYDQAQAVVDALSDHGFDLHTVSIVGADLRLVERVTGRMTRGRAALAGALSTGWLGLLFGLFLGLFAESGTGLVLLATYGLLFGAIFGGVLGFTAHAATGGLRDFSSTSGLAALRYDVLVEQDRAQEAERVVAQWAGASG